jgi:hypothetical protein
MDKLPTDDKQILTNVCVFDKIKNKNRPNLKHIHYNFTDILENVNELIESSNNKQTTWFICRS